MGTATVPAPGATKGTRLGVASTRHIAGYDHDRRVCGCVTLGCLEGVCPVVQFVVEASLRAADIEARPADIEAAVTAWPAMDDTVLARWPHWVRRKFATIQR